MHLVVLSRLLRIQVEITIERTGVKPWLTGDGTLAVVRLQAAANPRLSTRL